MTVEALVLSMAAKAANDLRIAKAHARDIVVNKYRTDAATGAPVIDSAGKYVVEDSGRTRYVALRVKARRTHYEDWIAALAFNHLFAGADAFVAAQLWDLPAHVGLRASPRAAALEFSVRW
jgi:hypothetical protein